MALSADDQRRYNDLDALNKRVAAGIAGRQAQERAAMPQELQPYINDTGYRGTRDLRGGFVGAATDAQAEKAMQDRATQSQYAAQNIAQMNAGADALRDLRATRLGISRGVLDQMEGRAANYAAPSNGIAGSGGSGSFDPFARPGDSYGDSQMRAQNYESLLKQAGTGTGITAKQRGAMLESAQGLMAPGTLIGEQDKAAADLASRERIAGTAQQAGIAKATLDAQTEMARQQADRQNQDRRFGLDMARFNLDQQKAQYDVGRQGVLDGMAQQKAAQINPDQIKAELMRRHLAGGEDSAAALEALNRLFPPSNPMVAMLGDLARQQP